MMMHAEVSERAARQRAQRRGLSLRKLRAVAGPGAQTNYWLVAGANSIVAGGDSGLTLDMIAAWLASSPELGQLSTLS
jgi:hypothetical protein